MNYYIAYKKFWKQKVNPEKFNKNIQFYTQPKIHKEGNPGGPVIGSVSCHTSKISGHVDYHFQPIVKQIPSYVKDKNKLKKK